MKSIGIGDDDDDYNNDIDDNDDDDDDDHKVHHMSNKVPYEEHWHQHQACIFFPSCKPHLGDDKSNIISTMIVTIIIDITIEMIIISITIIKKFCVLRKGILSSVWGYSAERV